MVHWKIGDLQTYFKHLRFQEMNYFEMLSKKDEIHRLKCIHVRFLGFHVLPHLLFSYEVPSVFRS